MGRSQAPNGAHDYQATLAQAHGLRVAAEQMSGALREALDQAQRAESVGPILDPTAFMRRREALREDIATMRAVLALAETREATTRGRP